MPSDQNTAASSTAATVEVFDNNRLVGTAAVTGNTWSLAVSPLSPGTHTFTAKSGTATSNAYALTVVDEGSELNLTRPHVREAQPAQGDKERLNYYNVKGDIHVVIPAYGMKTNDTVKLYWFGRSVTLGSPIQTVGSPPSLQPYVISKYEVIDVIGANATIWYTVRRPPSSENLTSESLALIVDGHSYAINAPTINTGHDNLRALRLPQFNSDTTAAMRCIAGNADSDVWSSDEATFGSAAYLNFRIDPAWRARNLGKPVKFNCSIRVNPSDGHNYLFSQLLRIGSL